MNDETREEAQQSPQSDPLQQPAVAPTNPQLEPVPKKSHKLAIILAILAVLLLGGGIAAYALLVDKDEPVASSLEHTTSEEHSEGDEHTETTADETSTGEPSCDTGLTVFADSDFGATFCYPSDWGTAAVMDAKVDAADTGYREAVRFSINTDFIVGGVSEDWTTTVGRDVACQEPSNHVPELSEYDTEWHDLVGSGMDVEFAIRSLVSSEGGYDMTEEVSNLLNVGVCVQGHKVISGDRYRVISAAYFSDFSEPAGITTPKAHIDNPNVLFSSEERTQLDALLASVKAY